MAELRMKQGLSAIAEMFTKAEQESRAAFLPFSMIGYPDYEQSLDLVEQMAQAGADGFEIGIPFSDPLADGPTIQHVAQVSLDNGTTVHHALNAVRELRQRGVTQPMMMFSYLNPLIAYGIEQFVKDAKEAGADGFIIPDLPPEEAQLFAACAEHDMGLVFFVAPTSNEKRIKLVSEVAQGFIYVVSVTGITGARKALPEDLTAFIQNVRSQTDKPLVLGFGISEPEHARQMNGLVDGFIVASAILRKAGESLESAVGLTQSLRQALD